VYEKNGFYVRNLLDDKIKTHLTALEVENNCTLEESLIDCESPIEQLLSLYLTNLQISFNDWNPFIEVSQIGSNQEIKRYAAGGSCESLTG
jgi:hypothetical protein